MQVSRINYNLPHHRILIVKTIRFKRELFQAFEATLCAIETVFKKFG